ncbi:hypothetical protein Droror1_Dr00018051, partial [Drosera rotundifolia]
MGKRNNVMILSSDDEDDTATPGSRSSSRRRTKGGDSKSSSEKRKSLDSVRKCLDPVLTMVLAPWILMCIKHWQEVLRLKMNSVVLEAKVQVKSFILTLFCFTSASSSVIYNSETGEQIPTMSLVVVIRLVVSAHNQFLALK